MMKTTRKMLVLLAMVMAFSMAFAFNALASTGSITINKASNIHTLEGQTFEAYQIFDVTYSADKTSYAYVITSAFEDFDDYPGASPTFTLADYLKTQADHTVAMNDLAGKLWKYIEVEGIAPAGSVTAGAPVPPATTVDSVTITGLDLGYYLVYGKGVTADGTVVVASCALTTTEPGATVNLKADAPDIDKKVFNHHDEIDDYHDWVDVNIGDTVAFKLESKVPKLTGYKTYKYIVHDRMSEGLTFQEDVKIFIGGTEIFAPDFTVVFPATDGHTFDIILRDTLLFEFDEGDDIIITYTAILNENAVVGLPGNPNEVMLEFSNDPYDDLETGETPWKIVVVYTGEIKFFKFALNSAGNEIPLAGAEFQLYRGIYDTGDLVWLIEENPGSAIDAAIYRIATQDEIDAPHPKLTDTIVTPRTGTVRVLGLGASYKFSDPLKDFDDYGDYYLIETKAPDGYHKLDGPIIFKYVFDYREVSPSISVWRWYLAAGGMGVCSEPIEIENKGGTRFPETGGIGRTIFYSTGAVLMLGAGLTLFVRRRRTSL